jgi:hypothetical protein
MQELGTEPLCVTFWRRPSAWDLKQKLSGEISTLGRGGRRERRQGSQQKRWLRNANVLTVSTLRFVLPFRVRA